MVKVREDMTGWVMSEHGVRDSMLTVLYQTDDYITPQGEHRAKWMCQCACGSDPKAIVGTDIRNGTTKSCGCLSREITIKNNISRKKLNKYDLTGQYGIGYCSNTGHEFYFDLEDYDTIKNYTWTEHILTSGYRMLEAWIPEQKKYTRMSVLLIGKNCDHIDRNTLNNRRNNLRIASSCENARNQNIRIDNTSGVIGVCWERSAMKWSVRINIDKTQKRIGYFYNKEDAIKARLEAEAKYYGEFAPQRHLFEQYKIKVKDGDN